MIIKKRRSLYLGLLIASVLMVITICGSSQAKVNNNSIYEYPDHKKLSNGYVFKTKKSDKGLRAYIIKKGRKSRVMATKYFRKKGGGYTEMFYATKYKGKYYFNAAWVCDGYTIKGIYRYKPGQRGFKKVKKNIMLHNKEHVRKCWAAYKGYLPSDVSPYNMCLFNMANNKIISLGSSVDAVKAVGGKFYYCKYSNLGRKIKIMVCKPNGKGKRTVCVRRMKGQGNYFGKVVKMTKRTVVVTCNKNYSYKKMKIRYR